MILSLSISIYAVFRKLSQYSVVSGVLFSSEVLHSLAPVTKMCIFIERTFLHTRADHEYNNDSQQGRVDYGPDVQFRIVQIHFVSHGDL